MRVRLSAPYFDRGELRFRAGDVVEMPDDIAAVEVAKGLAEVASDGDAPAQPKPAAAKGKKGA